MILLAILIPSVSLASFDNNLKYGAKGEEVVELQEFLIEQELMTGQATGNFYAVTLKAVKAFQILHNIKPVSGYFGSISRAKATSLLELEESNIEAVKEEAPLPVYQPIILPTYQAPTPIVTVQQSQSEPIILTGSFDIVVYSETWTNSAMIAFRKLRNTDDIILTFNGIDYTNEKVSGEWGYLIGSQSEAYRTVKGHVLDTLEPSTTYNYTLTFKREGVTSVYSSSFTTKSLTN